MSLRKRVAVIGAGPCGLGAIKALKEEGFEPVCFEKTGDYGGLWRYRDDDVDGIASVMKSTIINTSKELGAASDFPPPANFANYMHHTSMLEYIRMTAEKCGALEHICYHHQVLEVNPAKDYEASGRWTVTTENSLTKDRTVQEFDGVMVCIGHHVYPNMPSFAEQERFKGRIMHTHSLKKVASFEDKRVVVVGVGNSGMDAAVEISNVAKQVYLSSRRGAWVLPRVGPNGEPFDASFLRRYLIFFQNFLPYRLVCHHSHKALNQRFDHETYNLKPAHGVWSQHPTVSDTLPIKLLSGAVVTRATIKKFTENGVIFENEEKETEVDVVVLATGYQMKFPFLKEEILPVKDNRVTLYKYIYPPHLPHATLAILGLVQPSGPGFPVGEMQCRWSARVMSGLCSLPSKEQMYNDIRAKNEFNRKRFVDSPRHTVQVDFIGYQDELAALMGAKPNLWKMAFIDPKLFWLLLTGPSLPYQYRLGGPHSWDGARTAIISYDERIKAPFKRPSQYLCKQPSSPSGFMIACAIVFLLLTISLIG